MKMLRKMLLMSLAVVSITHPMNDEKTDESKFNAIKTGNWNGATYDSLHKIFSEEQENNNKVDLTELKEFYKEAQENLKLAEKNRSEGLEGPFTLEEIVLLANDQLAQTKNIFQEGSYWAFMNFGAKSMLDYVDKHSEYPNAIVAMHDGLNGLYDFDCCACESFNRESQIYYSVCQDMRDLAYNSLLQFIKKAEKSSGIKVDIHINRVFIRKALEEAHIKNVSCVNSPIRAKTLYWKFMKDALYKMNLDVVKKRDGDEDDVQVLRSAVYSALYEDNSCNNDDLCYEVRKVVNNTLMKLIEDERKKAGITDEDRQQMKDKKHARVRYIIEKDKREKEASKDGIKGEIEKKAIK